MGRQVVPGERNLLCSRRSERGYHCGRAHHQSDSSKPALFSVHQNPRPLNYIWLNQCFTTESVITLGYCAEWWMDVWAMTPVVSS